MAYSNNLYICRKHLPACCLCSRSPAGTSDLSRDICTLKAGAVVQDSQCGSTTYTYTTKLTNNDHVYHQNHDFACSRLLENTMPDIMHNKQEQPDTSHHTDVSYDSPARHTTICQQRTYDTAPCINTGQPNDHCAYASTSPVNRAVIQPSLRDAESYGTYMHNFIDVGHTNCVNLVPCSSYITPVTVASPADNHPVNNQPVKASYSSTSTFGKPQICDVTYMTSGVVDAEKTMPNQSCVTVNDGMCTVSLCDPDALPHD